MTFQLVTHWSGKSSLLIWDNLLMILCALSTILKNKIVSQVEYSDTLLIYLVGFVLFDVINFVYKRWKEWRDSKSYAMDHNEVPSCMSQVIYLSLLKRNRKGTS